MVRLTATFSDIAGVKYDPDSVTVGVVSNGVVIVEDGVATKSATGEYYYDFAPSDELYITAEFTGVTTEDEVETTAVVRSRVLVDTTYRKLLRITSDAMDDEIIDLLAAALGDLDLSGVVNLSVDPNIKRAISLYLKWQFGYDNPDADRLQRAYESLKGHLSLAGEYNAVE
jgi:PKD repeat protein